MTTYVDIYFQLFLFTEILLTFLFSNMSKIVSQLLESVRNTESNRPSAADRLSLKRCSLFESGCKGKSFFRILQVCCRVFFSFEEQLRFIIYFHRTACTRVLTITEHSTSESLQKGGVPAAPSGTATLLRLSPNHQFYPRPPLAVTDFRHPRLSWLDGRCVQGPGTYSPRHG